MLKLVHKYLRRLVVWVQTPSDEEIAAQRAVDREKRRIDLARNGLAAIRRGTFFTKWTGLTAQERIDLIADLQALGREHGAHPATVKCTTDAIERENNLPRVAA
jgi:hypothetical protein